MGWIRADTDFWSYVDAGLTTVGGGVGLVLGGGETFGLGSVGGLFIGGASGHGLAVGAKKYLAPVIVNLPNEDQWQRERLKRGRPNIPPRRVLPGSNGHIVLMRDGTTWEYVP